MSSQWSPGLSSREQLVFIPPSFTVRKWCGRCKHRKTLLCRLYLSLSLSLTVNTSVPPQSDMWTLSSPDWKLEIIRVFNCLPVLNICPGHLTNVSMAVFINQNLSKLRARPNPGSCFGCLSLSPHRAEELIVWCLQCAAYRYARVKFTLNI